VPALDSLFGELGIYAPATLIDVTDKHDCMEKIILLGSASPDLTANQQAEAVCPN
jgi:hypothetical protein